jgi:DNA-directed RNA polymerases I and III subunit RPAC1
MHPTAPTDQATDRNTLVFRLAVACTRNKLAPNVSTTKPEELYTNSEVLSSHFQWEPQGEQAVVYADNPPAPTNPNIVLVKLRPGQEVEMEMHAVKGVRIVLNSVRMVSCVSILYVLAFLCCWSWTN